MNTHTHWAATCLWKYSVCLDLERLLRNGREEKADLTDNLVDFSGVLQSQVVLRSQAVEVRGPLHLAQVFPVF